MCSFFRLCFLTCHDFRSSIFFFLSWAFLSDGFWVHYTSFSFGAFVPWEFFFRITRYLSHDAPLLSVLFYTLRPNITHCLHFLRISQTFCCIRYDALLVVYTNFFLFLCFWVIFSHSSHNLFLFLPKTYMYVCMCVLVDRAFLFLLKFHTFCYCFRFVAVFVVVVIVLAAVGFLLFLLHLWNVSCVVLNCSAEDYLLRLLLSFVLFHSQFVYLVFL